jgi:hypothetical protein
VSRRGYDKKLWQHQHFSQQLQQMKKIYTFGKSKSLTQLNVSPVIGRATVEA